MNSEWDEIAEKEWSKWSIEKEAYERDIILNWLKPLNRKSKVLDQGCGAGQYSIYINKMGFPVIGIDLSEKALKIAEKNKKRYKCNKLNFSKQDIRDTKFKDNQFDIIISAGIIEHFPETQQALKETSRILKKGGFLLIHVPHKIGVFTLLKKIQQTLGIWKVGYEKSFTIKNFSSMLEESGFKIAEIKIREYQPGKHRKIGKAIQILDKPLYYLGLGGHHMFYKCIKVR